MINKKIMDFLGPKFNFKYFQGLEIGLLKFKGFEDVYKPCIKFILIIHSFILALRIGSQCLI